MRRGLVVLACLFAPSLAAAATGKLDEIHAKTIFRVAEREGIAPSTFGAAASAAVLARAPRQRAPRLRHARRR